MPTIFFLGATGFIGGSVVVALHKSFPNYTCKALVRSEVAIDAFKAQGVPIVPVKGSFSDLDLITQQTADADFVVNAADADNVELRDAILHGFKKRFEAGKGVGSFIHTSGTGNYVDGVKDGKFDPNGKVWTDSERDVRALTESMWHAVVDVGILKAQDEGYVNAFILVPSVVHGAGIGPIKRKSIFFQLVIGYSLAKKGVPYIGDGSTVLGAVNIEDLVTLYELAFKALAQAKGKKLSSSPYERYVIASPEEYTFKEVASIFAKGLYELGKLESAEPVNMTFDEVGGVTAQVVGQNIMVYPVRARTLGWVASHATLVETAHEQLKLF